MPIFFHGEKHFLRLSVLPTGIRPGYITIVNMEGGRLPSPAPPDVALQQPALGLPVLDTSSTVYPSDISNCKYSCVKVTKCNLSSANRFCVNVANISQMRKIVSSFICAPSTHVFPF